MNAGSRLPRHALVALLAAASVFQACAASGPGPAGRTPDLSAAARSGAPAATTPSLVPTATLAPPRATPAPMPTPQLTPGLVRQLCAAILAVKARDRFPGVQVVIAYGGGWTWTARAGFANVSTRQAVSPTTLYNAGSITKTFVAALILQLVNQGLIGLDDPLSRWLPGLPYAPDVTIRELLNHTSGIDDAFNHAALLKAIDAAKRSPWSLDQVLAFVKKPYFAAGTGWAYSNTNYILLGRVIELATGQTVASLLRQRFFVPLGLTHTYLESEEPAAGGVAHGYDFTGHGWSIRDDSDGTTYLPYTSLATAIGTAGSLVTTAGDLALWSQALYGGRVLSPAMLAQMVNFTTTVPFHPRWPYGLGVMRISLDGFGSWGHSGTLSGFRSVMRYFPAGRLSIVVMTNINGAMPDDVVRALLAVLYPPTPS